MKHFVVRCSSPVWNPPFRVDTVGWFPHQGYAHEWAVTNNAESSVIYEVKEIFPCLMGRDDRWIVFFKSEGVTDWNCHGWFSSEASAFKYAHDEVKGTEIRVCRVLDWNDCPYPYYGEEPKSKAPQVLKG
jgi:hypothetical protein